MKSSILSSNPRLHLNRTGRRRLDKLSTPRPRPSAPSPVPAAPTPPGIRTTAREYVNPVDYRHPYPSMAKFADYLALHYGANRTRHAYYRQLRLLHESCQADPATLAESQLRDYFINLKTRKRWKPKSIRQALAAVKMFFVQLLGHSDWTLFSQIRTRDHDTLPPVLTRQQVAALLVWIRLRRYRTPLKLIYCCGLRLSECLGLTIHDIHGREGKLIIRSGKGCKDRVVPLPASMHRELQTTDWGVQVQPVGSGQAAIKYLGAYVARTAIADSRLLALDEATVTFRWKDRSDHDRLKPLTLPGVEFVRRYLRHVLPHGLRSVRYYGFCHPAAKAKRLRLQLLTAMTVDLGAPSPGSTRLPLPQPPRCPRCGGTNLRVFRIPPVYAGRGPPVPSVPLHSTEAA